MKFSERSILLAAILAGAAAGLSAVAHAQTAPVQIDVDLARTIGAYKPIYAWFGYDEANYTTAPNGQKLLRELHDLSPVPVYVRAHHLLTSGDGTPELKWSSTGVYREDVNGNPVYDFHILDGIFDAYMRAGVRPMVELGFMPKDLAAVLPNKPAQPYQVHFPQEVVAGASNNPPKDYAKWQELCRVVVAHLVERYGRDRVLTWYFEVWNEPDISYWHGPMQDYYRLYDAAVAGVRAALPQARVGGPATTGPGGPNASGKAYNALKGFLEHVRSTGVPLDFISFHVKGRPSIENGEVVMSIAHELQDADQGFRLIASFPEFRRTPIILSEADPEGCAACSAMRNPANAYRNGTLYPAYSAAAFAFLDASAEKEGVNLIGAVTWAFEFEGHDTFEGFRSLATNGIDKPILNFFRMAGMMSGERLAVKSSGAVPLDQAVTTGVHGEPDIDAIATRDNRHAAVMLWNYHDSEKADRPETAEVRAAGLPSGVHAVTIERYLIDATHGNAYTAWKAMGSPAHPTPDQIAQLQAAGALKQADPPRHLEARGGSVQWNETLAPESVVLFALSW